MEEVTRLLVIVAGPPLFGYLTMRFAAQKGRDTGGEKFRWFLLGFFLSVIGMIIALAISPKTRLGTEPQLPPNPAS